MSLKRGNGRMAYDEELWRGPLEPPAPAKAWTDSIKTYAALGGLAFGIVSAVWNFGGAWRESQNKIEQLDKRMVAVEGAVQGVASKVDTMSGQIGLLVQRSGWTPEVRKH